MSTLIRSLVFSLVLALASACAHAQGNPAIANCEEVQDPDTIEQMEICSAHLGCRMVLAAHKACTKLKTFLRNLGSSVGQGKKTLFGWRKEVSDENIWVAIQTPNTRRLEEDSDNKTVSDTVRTGLSKASSKTMESTLSDGKRVVTVGDMKDGVPDGYAIKYYSDGSILRGHFENGAVSGPAEKITGSAVTDGNRATGTWQNSQLSRGGFVREDHLLEQGEYTNGRLTSGLLKNPDGSRFEGRWDPNSGQRLSGTRYRPDGTIQEKGAYRNNELYAGSRIDPDGRVVATVDRERTEREEAEARQRLAIELSRRDSEKRALSEKKSLAEIAAQEREFRDRLLTLNPGQLYAMADDLRAGGNNDKSRQALRTLIARFPNHALAGIAAESLASTSTPAISEHRARQAKPESPSAQPSTKPAPIIANADDCSREIKSLSAFGVVHPDTAKLNAQYPKFQLQQMISELDQLIAKLEAESGGRPRYDILYRRLERCRANAQLQQTDIDEQIRKAGPAASSKPCVTASEKLNQRALTSGKGAIDHARIALTAIAKARDIIKQCPPGDPYLELILRDFESAATASRAMCATMSTQSKLCDEPWPGL
jgi:hypothetical protein